jgi:hypothetical protein
MALYELLVLGAPAAEQLDALNDRLLDVAQELRLTVPDEFALKVGTDAATRDLKATSIALYFGGDPNADVEIVRELERANVPIIPVLLPGVKVSALVPAEIQATNAYFLTGKDPGLAYDDHPRRSRPFARATESVYQLSPIRFS